MNDIFSEILVGIQNFFSIFDILLLLQFCFSACEKRKWRHYIITSLGFVLYAIILGAIFLYTNNMHLEDKGFSFIYVIIAGIIIASKKRWLVPFMLIPSTLIYYLWSNWFELLYCVTTLNKFDRAFTQGSLFSLCEDIILAIFLIWLVRQKKKHFPTLSLNILESVLVSVFSLFSLTFTVIFEILDETLTNGLYTFAWMIFVIILNIVIPYSIFHRCQTRYYRSQSRNYKEQFEMEYYFFQDYKKQQTEESKFRHDWKNHMILLESMFEKGEYEKAKEYFAKLTVQKKQTDNYFLTGSEIVDIILNAKQEKIQKYDIKVTCEGGLEYLQFMDSMDCCILFSNLIDNAIEANSKCTDDRFINIRSTKSAGTFLICIENRMCGQLQKEEERLLTTKNDKKNHGFGTTNAFEVIKKNRGQYHISAEDGIFCIKILFPCQEISSEI